ncbi:MAG: hexapeptide repeat-containing transferase [Planctomycetota bacterium]|nr:MAG: hexapeptide repeat-containing transferase [Planctomycetota bacterium]
MAKDVILFGTGDFARVASVYLGKDSPHNVIGFTVHEAFRTSETLLGKPVIPFERLLTEYPPHQIDMFVAMGFRKLNKARAEIYHACKAMGYTLITYVNSKASLWGEVEMGDNVFIFENNVVQPFVKIGCDTIVWSGNHLGHDAVIGSHCFITSHAVISGNVTIGDNCFIGVNATIRDGITIGAESVIGAGALILSDAAPFSVFQGTATEVSRVPSHRLRGL